MKKAVFLLLLAGLYSSIHAQNDLVIKKTTDMNFPGMDVGKLISGSQASSVRKSRTQTVWIKGSRLRSDSVMPTFSFLHPLSATRELSYIQQCDLGRTVHLDHKKKTYNVVKPGGNDNKTNEKIAKAKKGGQVDVSIQVSDTNERRDMFGFVAKHLKSTMTLTPGPGSCMKQPMSIADDGWYVELPTYACEIQTEDTLNSMQETDAGCADEVRVTPDANMHLGFPLQQTQTFSMGGYSFQMIETTISLDRANVDAGLFEIPSDFHPASDLDNADSTAAQSTTAGAANTPPPVKMPQNVANQYPPDWQNKPLPQMAQIANTGSLPAKSPGVIRVGIVTPTADMGQGFEGFDAGQIVQAAFLDKLKANEVESVAISSGVLIQEQAKAMQCDYLLYVDIKRKKGGGGGFLTKMIITNIGCMAGNAACAAASGASGINGRIKNKDEITLEYHLNKSDGSTAVGSTTLKKKAEKDGDDVLSPMITDASKNVISTLAAQK